MKTTVDRVDGRVWKSSVGVVFASLFVSVDSCLRVRCVCVCVEWRRMCSVVFVLAESKHLVISCVSEVKGVNHWEHVVCCVEGESRVLESTSLPLSCLKVCAKFICGKVRSPLGGFMPLVTSA